MQNSYIRYGRRFAIPSTAQILDELKTDFVPGYLPISRGYRPKKPLMKVKQLTHIDDRAVYELDRWENEGGALPTGHRRFIAGLSTETEEVLKDLDTMGGHREGRTKDEGGAMKFLVGQNFVKRSAYKGGLVTYEITNTGRELVRGLQS